jgi:methionyl aminopeptidase
MPVVLKRPDQIMIMREAGRIVARALAEMREAVKPGISTWELDQIAAKVIQQHGATPAFVGYPPGGDHPFPATITACINEELVHGIPSKRRILKEGDIVSLDTACHYKGFVGDAAFTMGVGTISSEVQRLLDITEKSLYVGIEASKAGRLTSDVSMAIQAFVEKNGFNVIREYTGHGVGIKMHEEPSIPNWWPNRRQRRMMDRRMDIQWKPVKLRTGMTYALEPMVTMGSPVTEVLDDHWTVVMKDGALSAHFEHTLAVVEQEAIILTLP